MPYSRLLALLSCFLLVAAWAIFQPSPAPAQQGGLIGGVIGAVAGGREGAQIGFGVGFVVGILWAFIF